MIKQQITSKMVKDLMKVYESNRESLHKLNTVIDEHGILSNGITDIHSTFEMGYHNALEYAFTVLNIKFYKGRFFDVNIINMYATFNQIQKLKNAYNSTREDLIKLKQYIAENEITDDGITNVEDSFEQGCNNALEYVFNVLDIN